MMRRNPFSKGDSWYPAGCNAYHTIFGGSARKGFAAIWENGALLSASARAEELEVESHLYPEDEHAGDGEYVFLALGKPATFESDYGYIFVFDPIELIEDLEAIFGKEDLAREYRAIVRDIISSIDEEIAGDPDLEDEYFGLDETSWHTFPDLVDRYLDDVEEIHKMYRFSGTEAKSMVEEFCAGDAGYSLSPEILVPDELPIEFAVGFIYAYIYFDADDFKRLIGGAEIGKPFSTPIVNAYKPRGYPYRCPLCEGPTVEGATLKEVLSQNPWRRVREANKDIVIAVECSSCGKFWREDLSDRIREIEPIEVIGVFD